MHEKYSLSPEMKSIRQKVAYRHPRAVLIHKNKDERRQVKHGAPKVFLVA